MKMPTYFFNFLFRKKYNIVFLFFLSLLMFSCSEITNPPESQIPNPTRCQTFGLDLFFNDTCSYDFIMDFISNFDSVTVLASFLGSSFYLAADSGNYEYWLNYFKNDSTIESIDAIYPKPDSIILVIKVSGKKSVEEEKERFLQISHLTIVDIFIYNQDLIIDVPEKSEERWLEIFEQYNFIKSVYISMVCVDT